MATPPKKYRTYLNPPLTTTYVRNLDIFRPLLDTRGDTRWEFQRCFVLARGYVNGFSMIAFPRKTFVAQFKKHFPEAIATYNFSLWDYFSNVSTEMSEAPEPSENLFYIRDLTEMFDEEGYKRVEYVDVEFDFF